MQKIQFGTRVKSVAIARSSVGEGVIGRAIVLDKNLRVKQIAYDNVIKRAVEVSQEDCIRLHLQPRPTYYMLVARTNTDMKGTVIGDDFTVEYIQMAESVYTDFADSSMESTGGKFNSVTLSLVKKGEYSYVKVMASNHNKFPQSLIAKIKEMRSNTELIESMWSMVDIATSMTVEDYEKALATATGNPAITAPQRHALPTRSDITSDSKEFDQGDDFGDDFGDDKAEDADAEEVVDKPKSKADKKKEADKKEADLEESTAEDAAGADGDDDDFGDFDK